MLPLSVTVNQRPVMQRFVQVEMVGQVRDINCGNVMAVIVPRQLGLVDISQSTIQATQTDFPMP